MASNPVTSGQILWNGSWIPFHIKDGCLVFEVDEGSIKIEPDKHRFEEETLFVTIPEVGAFGCEQVSFEICTL